MDFSQQPTLSQTASIWVKIAYLTIRKADFWFRGLLKHLNVHKALAWDALHKTLFPEFQGVSARLIAFSRLPSLLSPCWSPGTFANYINLKWLIVKFGQILGKTQIFEEKTCIYLLHIKQ